MDLVIRADGGPEIGYGHLFRSSAVAEVLLRRDNQVTVATTTPKSAREVYPQSCAVQELSSRDNPNTFIEHLGEIQPDGVITDAYPVDTSYQHAVREDFPLLVIQDDAQHTVCADILVNGNLYAPRLEYDYIGDEPTWCLGPEYVPLRNEIGQLADQKPPWHEVPERALVTMGGSDTAQLTPAILQSFDGVDVRVDAIVGPGYSEQQEEAIVTAAAETSADVDVLRDPENLPALMFEADFAVSTASTTTYELLALGTPIISIQVADNQYRIARELENRDAAIVLGRPEDDLEFRAAIDCYMSNQTLRFNRREKGRTLVDGEGGDRVVDAMLDKLKDDKPAERGGRKNDDV